MNAGLRVEVMGRNLSIAKNPSFFPFVPRVVRKWFTQFSGPTAEFDARVVIVRDPPATPDAEPEQVRVADGRLVFRNGTAAFHKFPYPIHAMSGIVEFDEKHLRFVDVRGRGPTGATVEADAMIAPLNKTPAVTVNVRARNAPLDDSMLEAMPEKYRTATEAVFNSEKYREMREADLVISSAEQREVLASLEELTAILESVRAGPGLPRQSMALLIDRIEYLERQAALPVFDLGGAADLAIRIHTPRGKEVPVSVEVDLSFAEAGALPEAFPYPIIGRGVSLKITDERVTLLSGEFEGLTGASARIEADVTLRVNGERAVRPDITVDAVGVPVDDVLLWAVPEGGDGEELAAGVVGPPRPPVSAQEICRSLNIGGTIDVVASIFPQVHEDGSRVIGFVSDLKPMEKAAKRDPATFKASVLLNSITASGRRDAEGGRVVLSNIDGVLDVTPERLEMTDVHATAVRVPDLRREGEPGATPVADIRMSLLAGLKGTEETPAGAIDLSLRASELAAGAPIETLVSIFSPRAGAFIERTREEYSIGGALDVGVEVRHRRDEPASERFDEAGELVAVPARKGEDRRVVTFSNLKGFSVAGLDGHFALDSRGGEAVLTEDAGRFTLDARGFDADMRYGGERAARVMADGAFSFTADPLHLLAPSDLTARLEGARLESPFTNALVRRGLKGQALEMYQKASPGGEYTLALSMDDLEDGSGYARILGELLPGPVRFSAEEIGQELAVRAGALRFSVHEAASSGEWRARGDIDGVVVELPELRIMAQGAWSYSGPDGFAIQSDVEAQAESFTAAQRAMMPDGVQKIIENLQLAVEGPWTLSGGRVLAHAGGGVAGWRQFSGLIRFSDARAEVGVPLTEASGAMNIRVAADDRETSPDFEVELFGVDVLARGVTLTNLETRIASRASSGTVEIPYLTANCHGGALWGEVSIDTQRADGEGTDEERPGARYRADVMLAGVAFAPFLDELAGREESEEDDAGAELASAAPEGGAGELDQSRGALDARVVISGEAGDPSTRTGEGSFRVSAGEVIRLPMVLQLIQLSNLGIPHEDTLDYLQAEFDIEGQTAVFEQIAVLSSSIAILGSGTVRLPEGELDMTFNSRGKGRVPILSDIYEMFRNEIVTTTITGTLKEPRIRSEPFVGTRRALGMLFGDDPPPGRDAQSNKAFREADRERRRSRSATTQAE